MFETRLGISGDIDAQEKRREFKDFKGSARSVGGIARVVLFRPGAVGPFDLGIVGLETHLCARRKCGLTFQIAADDFGRSMKCVQRRGFGLCNGTGTQEPNHRNDQKGQTAVRVHGCSP